MKNRESHFFSHLLQSKIFFIFLLCVVVISALRLSNEIARRISITSQISALKAQVEHLRSERDSLSYLMDSLSTDAYIEEAARKKLNLAKPGEQLIVIPAPENDEQVAKVAERQQSTARLWWDYFFDNEKS